MKRKENHLYKQKLLQLAQQIRLNVLKNFPCFSKPFKVLTKETKDENNFERERVGRQKDGERGK